MTTPPPNHQAAPEDRRATTAELSWMLWTAVGIGGIWVAVLLNGVRVVGHNGGSPGCQAQLDLRPDRGELVVMLTNQDQVFTPATPTTRTPAVSRAATARSSAS